MAATVHFLHPNSPSVSGFLRVGHTGHRKLEALLAGGRFPFRRVVFDAAFIGDQQELVSSLRDSGSEVVLDLNFAEMAAPGKYGQSPSKLPWANGDRPWQPSDFGRGRNFDIVKMMAEFAVAQNVNVVLAPTHIVDGDDSEWQAADLKLCTELRDELDRLGGNSIAVDYQLLTSAAFIRDTQGRELLKTGLRDLPIDNLWLRTSGFGATAKGAGTRKFIEAVRSFHELGVPVVADNVGGLAGLAACAFGAVGGICHGVGQKESFESRSWKKAPNDIDDDARKIGMSRRVYVPSLDRHLKVKELEAVFSAHGGKSRFGCTDKSCCQNGVEDMIENWHSHFIIQRSKQLAALSSVPEIKRAEHFITKMVEPIVRDARHGAKLKVSNEKVEKIISKAKERLENFKDAAWDLLDNSDSETRSMEPVFRGRGGVTQLVSRQK